MRKTIYIFLLILPLLILSSCGKKDDYDITTSIFPAYDIASNISGDKLNIKMLAKPGAEIHDYTPSSREIVNVKNSKLFIFASYDLDLWLNNNEQSILGKETKSLNLSASINTELELFSSNESNDHDHDHDHDHFHFWTDPIIFINLIDVVLEEIIIIDSSNEDYYRLNALNYKNNLLNAHIAFSNFLESKQTRLFFAGHNALSPFSERYNIEITSLSNTNKPDADFSLNQIIALLEEIKNNEIHFLFKEELSEAKIAKTIQKELGNKNYQLEILELHGYHNLTKEDFNNNITYLDLFNRNIQNIKKAVNWNEYFRS